jgi:MinD superfamily P-loop ATPase
MSRQIFIAVASGKGGTGKTMVSTSLALSLARQPENILLEQQTSPKPLLFLDGDVEAPNAHIFLNTDFKNSKEVGNLVPVIDESKCTFCGYCAEVCQYHAIAVVGKKTLVFNQLCHGCGSCTLNCPEGAISEQLHVIGQLQSGLADENISFARGIMNVGEPMAVPIIHQLKEWANDGHFSTVIMDASPGSSCPVVEAIRGADYLLLVTEPTPFGLHDLKLAVELAKVLKLPCGVFINRDGIGDQQVEAYCQAEGIKILARIPYRRDIAEALAQGHALVEKFPEYEQLFLDVYRSILSELDLLGVEASVG